MRCIQEDDWVVGFEACGNLREKEGTALLLSKTMVHCALSGWWGVSMDTRKLALAKAIEHMWGHPCRLLNPGTCLTRAEEGNCMALTLQNTIPCVPVAFLLVLLKGFPGGSGGRRRIPDPSSQSPGYLLLFYTTAMCKSL